jgi:signal transduction histidine kinase
MSMSLESLKHRLAPGESDREFVELEGAIDSAFHIGRELVALGKPPAHETSAVDVNDLLIQLRGVLARVLGPDVEIALQLDALDSLVEAQAVQLEWAFLNLAANSRDAMPDGGRFIVRTSSIDRQVASSTRTQRVVRMSVTDTGHGLFGDARMRAADPFFTTRESASGLGLTSVAMIARTFQGWMHIDSSDAGTTVHLHFPALVAGIR